MKPPLRASSLPMPQERLIERRIVLIEEGYTDWRIACIIAKELGVNPKMVEARLASLKRSGTICENPNRQAKRRAGLDLAAFRERLMAEGLCDGAIAKEVSVQSGRSTESVKTTISRLASDGKIPKNPNNQKEAGPDEYRWLWRRCDELASIGLCRHSISQVLACECGRSPEAIRRMIWALEHDGLVMDDVPRGRRSAEMQGIIVERAALIREGKDDSEIAQEIGKRLGRRQETIKLLIHRAVHKGGCPENENG